MKLALFQMDCTWENPAENLQRAEAWMSSAEADLILLPEMFTTGFTMQPERVAEPMDGPTVSWMREAAVRYHTAVAGSVAIRESDNSGGWHHFNRLVFVLPDGSYRQYDKRHLFRMGGEGEHYTGGTERLIVEYKGWKICPLICYDLRFPVWSRNTEEFDLLLYTANWPTPRREVWQTLLRARAIENLCYVAGVNRVGSDPLTTYTGDSAVIGFRGDPIAESLSSDAGMITAELDREALLAFRRKFPVHLDADPFTLIR